jgi:hypothetical protein
VIVLPAFDLRLKELDSASIRGGVDARPGIVRGGRALAEGRPRCAKQLQTQPTRREISW